MKPPRGISQVPLIPIRLRDHGPELRQSRQVGSPGRARPAEVSILGHRGNYSTNWYV
jgi:hypothetical protein